MSRPIVASTGRAARVCSLGLAAAATCLLIVSGLSAHAQKQSVPGHKIPGDPIISEPFAVLQLKGNLLSSQLAPMSNATGPDQTVSLDFVVAGNVNVTLAAEPTQFVQVKDGKILGKAANGAEAVGYDLILQFPKAGTSMDTRPSTASLPQTSAGATTPPLTVDLAREGLQRTGSLYLVTNENWTATQGIPLPGTYFGQVMLTITADF